VKTEHPAKPKHKAIEGKVNAHGLRFGIVVSRFNQFITERLLTSAIDCLHRTGAKDEDILIVRVPGAFEIPSAARSLAQTGKVDAIITLGCLLRGETSNYEHIAEEVTRGVGQSAQDTGVPHTWGVLTCDNLEQAIDRAGLKSGNKGFEAAMSAIEMASLQHQLKRGKRAHDQDHARHDAHGHAAHHAGHDHAKSAHDDRERRKHIRLSDLERVVVKAAEKHGKKI
jgi:6,7-dimethyl-8-ribityllumazine synthase